MLFLFLFFFLFEGAETKNERGVWRLAQGERVKSVCIACWRSLEVELVEIYPCYAASKTLSMLDLLKCLAVRMQD